MIGNDWDQLLESEFKQEYFQELTRSVKEEYRKYRCYPPIHDVFNAFRYSSYLDTKVVVMGQDPYHGPDQAMGLLFSVNEGVKFPPSLENIFKELKNDLSLDIPKSGNLTPWAKQGMLLLNAILSVREHQPLSHRQYGWERFTDYVIDVLNKKTKPIVFVLWGSYARGKKALITNSIHLVIENVHPSPLSASRGFFGSKPFSQINDFLLSTNQIPIDFRL
jgi:uracil-DNA glycosylase